MQLMAAQFSSWLDPLTILAAVPLGLIGVALTLWATGSSVNIRSGMGVLMLIGAANFRSYMTADLAVMDKYAISLMNLGGTAVLLCAGLSRFVFPLVSLTVEMAVVLVDHVKPTTTRSPTAPVVGAAAIEMSAPPSAF